MAGVPKPVIVDGTVYVPDDNEQGVGDWIALLAEEDLA